jgi:diaminopimelate decarboxylase
MLTVRDGELHVGGLPASTIVQRHGEPVYVYDTDVLTAQARNVRRALPACDLLYSMKANPNPSIAAALRGFVHGLDVSSLRELRAALRAGYAANQLFFVGPSKSDQELQEAVRLQIGCLIVESEQELDEVNVIGSRLGLTTRVAIRVNPAFDTAGPRLRMGGVARQFGIDEEVVPGVAVRAASMPWVTVLGFHAYVGTRILDWATIARNFEQTLELGDRLASQTGLDVQLVDLGGGFGIPYFPGETELDLQRLGAAVQPLVAAAIARRPGMRVFIELGRYLAGPAGVYLARVRYVKRSRGRLFALISGGLNHHQATTGLGGILKGHFPMAVANKMDVPAGDEPVAICGPLCTPSDVLAKSIELPPLERGDLIALMNSGAYGLTASPLEFLSHEWPLEVLVHAGESTVIRAIPEDHGVRGAVLQHTQQGEAV